MSRKPTIPITGTNGGRSRFVGTDDDTRALLVAAEQAHWRIVATGGGHWKIFPPKPAPIIIAGHTASCPRSAKNLRAQLRRAGLAV